MKYAIKEVKENMAKAAGRDLPISFKQSIEICNTLRYMETEDAKRRLEDVLDFEVPIRFKRFTNGLGHKAGKGGAGRYPQNACKAFLQLIKQAESNAQTKGLGKTKISHIVAQKASAPMRYGRQGGRASKRTHVEVVLKEIEKAQKKAKKEKVEAKKEVKPATKPEVKKEAVEKKAETKQESKSTETKKVEKK